jgi:hypothetical protein
MTWTLDWRECHQILDALSVGADRVVLYQNWKRGRGRQGAPPTIHTADGHKLVLSKLKVRAGVFCGDVRLVVHSDGRQFQAVGPSHIWWQDRADVCHESTPILSKARRERIWDTAFAVHVAVHAVRGADAMRGAEQAANLAVLLAERAVSEATGA